MEYKIVQRNRKIAAGIKTRISNSDPKMTKKIGAMWQTFFGPQGYQAIPGKIGESTFGLYTNYENEAAGAYDLWVCCEVNSAEHLPKNIQSVNIEAGKYAEFVVFGDSQKAVGQFWQQLWAMPLNRKFASDFEEYRGGEDEQHQEIHIFISLN